MFTDKVKQQKMWQVSGCLLAVLKQAKMGVFYKNGEYVYINSV